MPAPEFARLAAAYGNAPTEQQKNALVECACRAYVGGAADVPSGWDDAKQRLLPQLWTLSKIRQKQSTLPPGVILPYCGLHGEDDSTLYDVGVVLVCDFAPEDANNAPSLETVVLSKDIRNWSISWTDALRSALDNLRQTDEKAGGLFCLPKEVGAPSFRMWVYSMEGSIRRREMCATPVSRS